MIFEPGVDFGGGSDAEGFRARRHLCKCDRLLKGAWPEWTNLFVRKGPRCLVEMVN